MTNEEIVIRIKEGGQDLLPLLWEQSYMLIYAKCSGLYRRNKERLASCGIELCDLKQESYIAFLAAIEAYKPEKGYKFLTYIPLQLKLVLRSIISNDTLNRCSSLDEPIQTEDGELDLYGVIKDEAAEQPFEDVDTADLYRELHCLVDELPEQQRDIINAFYFKRQTLNQIAERQGISYQRVAQLRNEATKILRKPKNSRRLHDLSLYRHKSFAAYCVDLTSVEEDYIERKERLQASGKG